MNIAIIPARGGSKRIPRKNIKLFCGQPMIAWSIQAAIESECFDRIVVSTDDKEIAEVARTYGAETPFVRSPELSNDHVATLPVIANAIEWIKASGGNVENACCIYATAPFVVAADLQNGLSLLKSSAADYAFTVTSFPFPIQRAVRITSEDRIQMFQPEHLNSRSQDLEEAWHDAGQFYWGKAKAWLTHKLVFSKDSIPIKLPRYRVQDIDTQEDWDRAAWMFQAWKNNKGKLDQNSGDVL